MKIRQSLLAALVLVLRGGAVGVAWAFNTDRQRTRPNALQGSAVVSAPCGPIEYVLATPPELLEPASAQECTRVNAILESVLPVAPRAEGLRSDSALGKHLLPSPLKTLRLPVLVFSARDDRYGTYASAAYTASQIPGARFTGFEQGGYLLVGHIDEVMAAVAKLLVAQANP